MINNETIYSIANKIRHSLEAKYGPNLSGKCIEASETIINELKRENIPCYIIHGYFFYITKSFQHYYFPHSWVELSDLFIDVTLTQFQDLLEETIPPIIIGKKPNFLITIPIKDEYVPKKLLY